MQSGTYAPRVVNPHVVGILLADGVELLDVAGPQGVLKEAVSGRQGLYRIVTIGMQARPVTAEGGITIAPDERLADEPLVSTLVFPGGSKLRRWRPPPQQLDHLRRMALRAQRLVTICTGAFLLARTGILHKRKVVTHWRYAEALANEFPDIEVDGNSIYRRDGNLWSSGGVTAGIDLALALVRQDHGTAMVSRIARELNVYLHRPGDQAQYSEPLELQYGVAGGFAGLVDYVMHNPGRDTSVPALAARMNMSERTFSRRFARAAGMPPAKFFERLRLDMARQMLGQGELRVQKIARLVGYNSADAFTRAFERVFAITPSFYRRHCVELEGRDDRRLDSRSGGSGPGRGFRHRRYPV